MYHCHQPKISAFLGEHQWALLPHTMVKSFVLYEAIFSLSSNYCFAFLPPIKEIPTALVHSILGVLLGVWECSCFNCIFLMSYESFHLPMWRRVPFQWYFYEAPPPVFLLGCFSVFSFKYFSYILDKRPLSDVALINIFSKFRTWFFILLRIFSLEQIFNFSKTLLVNSFFHGSCL